MNDPRVPYGPHDQVPDVDKAVEASESDGYSATALGSHWFERPEAQPEPETATLVQGVPDTATLVQGEPGTATVIQDPPDTATLIEDGPDAATQLREEPPASVAPDRVEGDVLRFGPGVTAAVLQRNGGHNTTAEIWHGTLPGQPAGPAQPPARRRSGLRRYALAGTVLLAVLAFLAWQRYGPALAVKSVTVQTTGQALGCDSTADIVGALSTNGRPGTVTYRWERSDGTTSGLLREKLTRGQKQARLHLLWTFQGKGEYRAAAVLRIVSPTGDTATTRFSYHCA
ncbi:hypothetical protein FBY35_0758 [Streptomyces sp. SLBN-118]|uniref:hypothetical protein n=1 Tax=Streptomyces sp. SLBN-118 TaxID=2768454 RepID=UPI00114EDFE6|nr:hypothetical protein [Streptomyces sp. SLBN-118]TQK50428.1 hypothetical protein FBY35_0758 [Streptomyces sp. SLBN-118]